MICMYMVYHCWIHSGVCICSFLPFSVMYVGGGGMKKSGKK